MTTLKPGSIALSFYLALLASSGDALGQQTTTTTATYSDWTLQCLNEVGPPTKKACNIAQTTQMQGKNVPFSRVAIEGPVKGRPVKLLVQVPVNVSMTSQIVIQSSDSTFKLTGSFARCIPAGCFAELDVKDEALKRFNATEDGGKLTFNDASGREIAVPVSFKGFHQSFDALSKE